MLCVCLISRFDTMRVHRIGYELSMIVNDLVNCDLELVQKLV